MEQFLAQRSIRCHPSDIDRKRGGWVEQGAGNLLIQGCEAHAEDCGGSEIERS